MWLTYLILGGLFACAVFGIDVHGDIKNVKPGMDFWRYFCSKLRYLRLPSPF